MRSLLLLLFGGCGVGLGCGGEDCRIGPDFITPRTTDGGFFNLQPDAEPDAATCALACPDAQLCRRVDCCESPNGPYVLCGILRPLCYR